jgi:predicted secreted acid phosphatase
MEQEQQLAASSPVLVYQHPYPFAQDAIEQLRVLTEGRRLRKQPAVVFDIDQTAFLYNVHVYDPWTKQHRRHDFHEAVRNEEIYSIYRYAIEHGMAIFFITARQEAGDSRQRTLHDLERLGYGQMSGLFLRPDVQEYRGRRGVARYKSNVRRWLWEHGYSILLNAGDKWQDLHGGYAKIKLRLPDIPTVVESASLEGE